MRKAIYHIVLILLLPLFITGCKKTEIEATINTGNFEGKITDNTNGQPIPAAEVKISGTNQTIASGADGTYKFISLEPREYQITVSKQNYVQEIKPITVIAGQTLHLDFALSPFSMTITPTNQNVGDTAGTTQFTITSNINWNASVDQPWCSIDKTSGNGNNIITVTYQANTTISERKATLKITGNTLAPENVTITQSLSVFPQVIICNRVWMVKNLDVATYRNGDPIPNISDQTWAYAEKGAYCYYRNDSATYAGTYGKLYNWYAVHDPRGLAPAGWHVPSDAEWTELTTCLGGETVAGGKMKAVTPLWIYPNFGATNISGFSGLPGGLRTNIGSAPVLGQFQYIGRQGYWWTSSGILWAWYRHLYYDNGSISRGTEDTNFGFSVRCITD